MDIGRGRGNSLSVRSARLDKQDWTSASRVERYRYFSERGGLTIVAKEDEVSSTGQEEVSSSSRPSRFPHPDYGQRIRTSPYWLSFRPSHSGAAVNTLEYQ